MIFLTVLQESFEANRPIDDELILKIAKGEIEALRELYDSTASKVYGFVLSILKNRFDADDVLQETFLTVFNKAPGYSPQGKPMAWILVIAKNHAMTKLREKSRLQPVENEERELPFTEFDFDGPEQREIITAAFRVLGDDERRILMLHAVSGVKHREIAVLLELPLNTVLSKYHRAIKKMKEELKKG